MNLRDLKKVCGTCRHVRLTLGIVTSLDFKRQLEQALKCLKPCNVSPNTNIDNELLSVLALANDLGRQKFYCRKEQGWTHLFDKACFAWQPRKRDERDD